jgi:hypothetical protein
MQFFCLLFLAGSFLLLQAFNNLISRKYLHFEDILCILINFSLDGRRRGGWRGGGGREGHLFYIYNQENLSGSQLAWENIRFEKVDYVG